MPQDSENQLPLEVFNPNGMGPVVILCEHASCHIPQEYDDLGLPEEARNSHVAWDPGARAVSLILSKKLDAPLIAGTVSRLIYDCNRPPEAESAMPPRSEVYDIPGNQDLSLAARDARTKAVYRPFCDGVAEVLDWRLANALPTAIVTIHSFTPIYHGQPRQTELGLLHDADATLANAMLDRATRIAPRRVELNQPYSQSDGVTHSLKLHAVDRGLHNVMVEIRNDLVRTAEQEAEIARELLSMLKPALEELGLMEMGSAHG